jgi:hypothetical protein
MHHTTTTMFITVHKSYNHILLQISVFMIGMTVNPLYSYGYIVVYLYNVNA